MTVAHEVLQRRIGIGFDRDVEGDTRFIRTMFDDGAKSMAYAGQQHALAIELLEGDCMVAGEASVRRPDQEQVFEQQRLGA